MDKLPISNKRCQQKKKKKKLKKKKQQRQVGEGEKGEESSKSIDLRSSSSADFPRNRAAMFIFSTLRSGWQKGQQCEWERCKLFIGEPVFRDNPGGDEALLSEHNEQGSKKQFDTNDQESNDKGWIVKAYNYERAPPANHDEDTCNPFLWDWM